MATVEERLARLEELVDDLDKKVRRQADDGDRSKVRAAPEPDDQPRPPRRPPGRST